MTGYEGVRLEHAEVRGERVHLRPVSPNDAAAAYDLLHDEDQITSWIVWEGPERQSDLEERYTRWIIEGEDETLYAFAIEDESSGEWAGSIGLHQQKSEPVASLGYLVGVPYQGRGLGTEAVRHVVELAFRELDLLLVRADVFSGNIPSIRVLEKVGLRRDEGVEIFHEKRGDQVLLHSYSISRVDWELAAPPKTAWQVRSTRED